MRLAYLCVDPGIPVFGTKGASVHVQEVVRSFRSLGWDVTIYCTRRGDLVPADLADVRVVERRVAKGETAERERAVAAAGRELATAAASDGFDLVYERYALFSTAGATASTQAGRPLVVEVNAPLVEEQRRHRELVDDEAAWSATSTTFAAATTIACVSDPVADWVRPLADHDRVHVRPNGVNTTRISPGDAPEGPFTVGFVGTLKPWHGLDTLMDAMQVAGRPDWRLLVCGDGPERAAVEARARTLPVTVELTGALAPEDIPEQLRRMHVATAPYPDVADDQHYFSPLKLYEYFAAGLPVVASRIGQTTAVVDEGVTGLLVPPSDPVALGAALGRVADDPAWGRRIGAAARARAVAVHDWNQVVASVLDDLREPVR